MAATPEPTNEEGLTLKEWLAQVDSILIKRIGLTHRDLADFPSWNLWHDGVPPEEGADECISGDDTFDGFDV